MAKAAIIRGTSTVILIISLPYLETHPDTLGLNPAREKAD
jgi:hypothetical protein